MKYPQILIISVPHLRICASIFIIKLHKKIFKDVWVWKCNQHWRYSIRRRKKVSSNIHNVASFLLATIYLHSIHKIMCKTFLNNNNNFIRFFFSLVEKKGRKQAWGNGEQREKYWMERNEKSCILINIFLFFMIMLIWIFMLVIKRKFIQINRKIHSLWKIRIGRTSKQGSSGRNRFSLWLNFYYWLLIKGKKFSLHHN